jgi:hypothetical protein
VLEIGTQAFSPMNLFRGQDVRPPHRQSICGAKGALSFQLAAAKIVIRLSTPNGFRGIQGAGCSLSAFMLYDHRNESRLQRLSMIG